MIDLLNRTRDGYRTQAAFTTSDGGRAEAGDVIPGELQSWGQSEATREWVLDKFAETGDWPAADSGRTGERLAFVPGEVVGESREKVLEVPRPKGPKVKF
ncbi:hypothetical protein [Halosimplex carlsbadense]|uniref:hypothetical protein n=1 Tax=Halosimplex carlsbadense TaxID=171164 RepID=UPI00126923DA|nr:hypothetical protein [Halosimplex carlsbadense]